MVYSVVWSRELLSVSKDSSGSGFSSCRGQLDAGGIHKDWAWIERAHCCFLATNIIERHNLFRLILSTALMMFSRFRVVFQCQVFSYQNGHHFAWKGLRAFKFATVQMLRKKRVQIIYFRFLCCSYPMGLEWLLWGVLGEMLQQCMQSCVFIKSSQRCC